MKRLCVFLLAVGLLLSLVGCHKDGPLVMEVGQSDTDFEGVEVQIVSLDWSETENKTTLVVEWINHSKYEITYGEPYSIERLDGGEWVSCAIAENLAFEMPAYPLAAGKKTKKTYVLTNIFDISSPGHYRFKTDCYVEEAPAKSTKCELVAEFVVLNEEGTEGIKATGTAVQYGVRYIRTDGGSDGVLFPCIRIIHSLQELKDYYNTWHEVFDLERKEKVHGDTTIGFLDACDAYDEAFFEKNYLIFVLLEEGSGSIHHEVRSVEQTPDQLISISVDRKVPEVGTTDMAQWHIILELSRDVLVENSVDTMLFVDGLPSYMDDQIVHPQTEGAFKKPPEGTLITPEGNMPLRTGGYSWFCKLGNGLEEATIADQVARPLPKESMEPISIGSQYAETVYAPVPGSDVYEPTNSLGYLLKLSWEVDPASVTYTCWPEAVWEKENTPEESVVSQELAFYAKTGGYIYEIVATWDDVGAGYHGTANYYVYITGEDETHVHMTALRPQTVENPVTGYCGNTWTTLYIGKKEYSFMYGNSVTLTDILVNLKYDPMQVCRCPAEYMVDTEFGKGYGINLTAGYARCDKGQADLTQEQIDTITEIIKWAETTNCKYPLND